MDKIGNYRKVGILNVSIPCELAEILTNFKLKKKFGTTRPISYLP